MSDWQQDLSDFNEGFTDSAKSRQPWNRLNQTMQMGRRAAGHDSAGAAPPPATGGGILSGLTALLGLAGLIIGFFLGANFLDMGWIGVVIMLGSAALGLAIGSAPIPLLQWGFRSLYEKSLWRSQASENTADKLVQFWEGTYGEPPQPELLEAMDGNGSAWVMDRKGNFILRMKTGKNLFVGFEQEANGAMSSVVRNEGKGLDIEDARNIMLAYKSLGRTSTSLFGSRNTQRLLWVAARLADIEVNDYRPDRKALELIDTYKN